MHAVVQRKSYCCAYQSCSCFEGHPMKEHLFPKDQDWRNDGLSAISTKVKKDGTFFLEYLVKFCLIITWRYYLFFAGAEAIHQ